MNVVDHEPKLWFLLEEAGVLFVDGNYSHSFLGYDWPIQLNENEVEQFQTEGREFISRLVEDIQESVPILTKSNSPYKNRRVSNALNEKAITAIREWRQGSS